VLKGLAMARSSVSNPFPARKAQRAVETGKRGIVHKDLHAKFQGARPASMSAVSG